MVQNGILGLNKPQSKLKVQNLLTQKAKDTQGNVLSILRGIGSDTQSSDITSFWIFIGALAKANQAAIIALAALPEVQYIYANEMIHIPPDERVSPVGDVGTLAVE
jgi:hypothetical protein